MHSRAHNVVAPLTPESPIAGHAFPLYSKISGLGLLVNTE